MMVTRRTLLKSGLAVAVIAGAGASQAASAAPDLVVFDSRVPTSLAFARGRLARAVDVASADATFWRSLRDAAPAGPVTGLTGWSDWVIVRGLLEEKGLRLKSETQHGRLFRWTMA